MPKSETTPITDLVPLRQLAAMLDDTSSAVYRSLRQMYPSSVNIEDKARLCKDAVECFSRHFGADSEVFVVRAPGRVNLLGMHVDHRGGYTNPIAISEVFFVVSPRQDDIVELRDMAADRFGPASFRIVEELPQGKIEDWDTWTHHECERRTKAGTSGDWANYIKSAVLYLRIWFRAKGWHKLVMVSDVVPEAGQTPGVYQRSDGSEVRVHPDGRITPNDNSGNLAGAGHLLDRGVAKALTIGNLNLAQCLEMATVGPAAYMGLRHLGTLAPGKEASLFLFDRDIGDTLNVRHTVLAGEVVYSA